MLNKNQYYTSHTAGVTWKAWAISQRDSVPAVCYFCSSEFPHTFLSVLTSLLYRIPSVVLLPAYSRLQMWREFWIPLAANSPSALAYSTVMVLRLECYTLSIGKWLHVLSMTVLEDCNIQQHRGNNQSLAHFFPSFALKDLRNQKTVLLT
jgi:hypothetical protein